MHVALMLAILLLTACTGHKQRNRILLVADSLMLPNPDSVYQLLNRHADEFTKQQSTLSPSKSQRMRYQLLLAEAMNKTARPFTSDSVGKALTQYYDHWLHGDANLRMRAYYMLGCAYRDQGNAPRALENYQRAVSHADTADIHCDLNVLMRVHSQMSRLYLQQRLFELEKKELLLAESLSWEIGDTLSALIFAEHLCNSLYNKGKYRECIRQADSLCQAYIRYNHPYEGGLAHYLCIKSYYELQDYKHMKEHIDLYERNPYLQIKPQQIVGGIGALYIYKGQYNIGIKDGDSAIFYFQKAMPYKALDNNELLIYGGLRKAYAIKKDVDSLIKYTQLYSEAKERSFDDGQTQATILAKELYDYGIEQKTANEKSAEASRLKSLFILAISALAISIIFVLLILYRNERKKRIFRELQQRHQRAINALQEKERELSELRLEKASNDNAIMASIQHIEDLKQQVLTLESQMTSKDSSKRNAILRDTDVIKYFKKTLIPVPGRDTAVNDDDWERLGKTIEGIFPNFYDIMNNRQQLSVKDYRVCLLTKGGFCSSDIENLMNQKQSYASTTKKRLHKKVFGYEGSAADFDAKLHRI